MPLAVSGAICMCSFGTIPTPLTVVPKGLMMACGLPIATVTDCIPMVNIAPFGMCNAPSNPSVAAATAAAAGVFTPMPCVPAVTAPWAPTKPNMLSTAGPVVCGGDRCMCSWCGIISITNPGQVTVL
ncbi:MAG: DUF4280 domain-containing protein [Holosporales bacterium]|nr:DUF4280 domain-containing protein [Holosporales bacterium]